MDGPQAYMGGRGGEIVPQNVDPIPTTSAAVRNRRQLSTCSET